MTSADSSEEEFDELLLAIDSRLADGCDPFNSLPEVAPPLRERIVEASECMHLLDLMRTRDSIQTPHTSPDRTARTAFALRSLPSRCNQYLLTKKLGEGGFGTVYLAEDTPSNRQVAIKIPHLRSMQDPQSRKRFQTETRVLEQLRHPAIVSIVDSGECDELPFLVMEFCDSGNLTQLLAELDQRPSPEWCARLILDITRGLGQAHSRGILHRDIKPHNVLLKRPDDESQSPESIRPRVSEGWRHLLPMLADFGLAKWNDQRGDSDRTRAGIVAGTPQYMAPEQAAGLSDRICPATDVHGVGLVLYEMLTGQQPFVGDTEAETRWNIVHREPTAIRKLRPAVPRDLETICHRALEKDQGRRFLNANELAEDLERYLNRRPIKSKPVSRVERLWRWCRRHPDRAMMISVIACLVTLISVGGWWSSSQMSAAYRKEVDFAHSETLLRQTETRLRKDAERRQQELARQTDLLKLAVEREQLLTYTAQIRLAADLFQQGQELGCADLLQTMRPSNDQDHDYRDFCWRWLNSKCGGSIQQLPGLASSRVRSINLIPDKNMIVAGNFDGTTMAWDARTFALLEPELPVLGPDTRITGIDYLPDTGTWIFTDSGPDSTQPKRGSFHIRWWSPTGLSQSHESDEQVRSLYLCPDRSRFSVEAAEMSHRRFDVYSSTQYEKLWSAPSRGTSERLVSWSLDGYLAVPDGANVVIYAPEGREVAVLNHPQDNPSSIETISTAFSPSGQRLAVLRANHSVDLWQRQSHSDYAFQRTLTIPQSPMIDPSSPNPQWHAITFVRGDHLLACKGPDGRVNLWNLNTNRIESRSLRFSSAIIALHLLSNGQFLVHDMFEKVYRWSPIPIQDQLPGHQREAWTTDFSSDGRYLITGGDDATLKQWDLQTRQEDLQLEPHPSTIVQAKYSPRQDRLASLCLNGSMRVWDLDPATRKPVGPPRVSQAHRKARTLAWSPDGKTLATGGYDGEVILHDASTLEVLRQYHDHTMTVRQILWIQGGQQLLTVSNDYNAVIREAFGADAALRHWREGSEIHSAVLLADTGLVALGLKSGTISIRQISSGTLQGTLVGHQNWVRSLALSPDGRVLASGDESGLVRFWRVENLQLLLSQRHGNSSINQLAFSPSGDTLAIADHEGKITLWPADFEP